MAQLFNQGGDASKYGPDYRCCHCGDPMKGKRIFCDNCTTKPKRLEMDEANKKHFEKGGFTFVCRGQH